MICCHAASFDTAYENTVWKAAALHKGVRLFDRGSQVLLRKRTGSSSDSNVQVSCIRSQPGPIYHRTRYKQRVSKTLFQGLLGNPAV